LVEQRTSIGATGPGNRLWDGVKFGEPSQIALVAIPSQAPQGEGVETRWRPPKAFRLR
jgi:hypothetical protein